MNFEQHIRPHLLKGRTREDIAKFLSHCTNKPVNAAQLRTVFFNENLHHPNFINSTGTSGVLLDRITSVTESLPSPEKTVVRAKADLFLNQVFNTGSQTTLPTDGQTTSTGIIDPWEYVLSTISLFSLVLVNQEQVNRIWKGIEVIGEGFKYGPIVVGTLTDLETQYQNAQLEKARTQEIKALQTRLENKVFNPAYSDSAKTKTIVLQELQVELNNG